MVQFGIVQHLEDLNQILRLQKDNHRDNLPYSSQIQNGFVSVLHSFHTLELMHHKAPQIIAKAGDEVVGYALVMPKEFQADIPMLTPMFSAFKKLSYGQMKINDWKYYVMGQICVKSNYRRQGIFTKLYEKHKELLSCKFDFCITEISTSNKPSLLAHEKVGFKTIHTFEDKVDQWDVVVWDWRE